MNMIAPPFARRPVRARLAALAASLIVTLPMAVAAPAALATTTGINVTLPLGHRIQGVITDQDGHPVDGAEVVASAVANSEGTRDLTDATGRYLLRALRDATYHVHVDPPRRTNLLERWYGAPDSNPEEVGAVDVVVEGADVTGIDVQLEAGLQILGTVTDPDGNPVSGVQVGRGISDAQGRYAWAGLRPGEYTVFVSPPEGSDFLSGPLLQDGTIGGPDDEGYPLWSNPVMWTVSTSGSRSGCASAAT
jgi:Carboxypeptidase regulatory-like domain